MKKKLTRIVSLVLAASMVFTAMGCTSQAPEETSAEAAQTTAEVTEVYSAETATDMAITLPVPTVEESAAETVEQTSAGTAAETAAETASAAEVQSLAPATPSKYDATTQKLVALTFDDGPDTGNTKATTRIVDIMERYNAHCTFFAVGEAIKEWFPTSCVDVMKKAVSIGCEYATHTYSHANLNQLDADGIQKELDKSIAAIEEITGQKVTLLRPPYGNAKDNVTAAVDMPMIQWDVDTLDWDTKDPANTLKVVQETVKPGSIVLMHDIYRQTADAVESMVPWLQEHGYTLVTVTELFEAYGIPLEGHKQYYNTEIIM